MDSLLPAGLDVLGCHGRTAPRPDWTLQWNHQLPLCPAEQHSVRDDKNKSPPLPGAILKAALLLISELTLGMNSQLQSQVNSLPLLSPARSQLMHKNNTSALYVKWGFTGHNLSHWWSFACFPLTKTTVPLSQFKIANITGEWPLQVLYGEDSIANKSYSQQV